MKHILQTFLSVLLLLNSVGNGYAGTISSLNLATTGTAISSTAYNSNMNTIKDAVNNIVADQITDGTITNAEIHTTAAILLSKLSTSAYDATAGNFLENYRDGCDVYRVDGDNVGVAAGTIMINGKMRRNASAITNITYSVPDGGDWLDIWALADANAATFTCTAVDSATSPGGTANPGTNGRLIGSIKYDDGTAKINLVQNYYMNYITGWTYKVGSASQAVTFDTVTFGRTFVTPPIVTAGILGIKAIAAKPTDLTSFSGSGSVIVLVPGATTTTTKVFYITTDTGNTIANTEYWGLGWVAYGRHS